MRYRPLGATGLTVSEIGFGAASWWGKRQFDENEAVRLVHAAIDGGVTFFDTGASYCAGEAEPRLGRALRGRGAPGLVVATKAGSYPAGGGRFAVEIGGQARLEPLTLLERGPVTLQARALIASLSTKIAKRELGVVRQRLGLGREQCSTEAVDGRRATGDRRPSTGSVSVVVRSRCWRRRLCRSGGFGARGGCVSAHFVGALDRRA